MIIIPVPLWINLPNLVCWVPEEGGKELCNSRSLLRLVFFSIHQYVHQLDIIGPSPQVTTELSFSPSKLQKIGIVLYNSFAMRRLKDSYCPVYGPSRRGTQLLYILSQRLELSSGMVVHFQQVSSFRRDAHGQWGRNSLSQISWSNCGNEWDDRYRIHIAFTS